jgi:type II secretory pathway pseudopilin PulG
MMKKMKAQHLQSKTSKHRWLNMSGMSVIELMIVVGLIGTTALAASRVATYMLQSNNGLLFRMQRLEVRKNLRQIYFASQNCRCLFQNNGLNNVNIYNQNTNLALANSIALRVYSNPQACVGPQETILSEMNAPDPLLPVGSDYKLKNFITLSPSRKLVTFEYTIETNKEIFGPKQITENILFTLTHINGVVSNCGQPPNEDIVRTPFNSIPLANINPAYNAAQNVNIGVIAESLESGVYLARMNFVVGSDPEIVFYAPTTNPQTRTQIAKYTYNATASGVRIRNKGVLVLLPVFNGSFFYGLSNGGIARIQPIYRMPLPYPVLKPMVQFNTLSIDANPRSPIARHNNGVTVVGPGPINVPITISTPNTLAPGGITVNLEVVNTPSGPFVPNALPADYTLPAPIVFPLNGAHEQTAQVILTPTGPNKVLILRLNAGNEAIPNYPNEYVIRFSN